MYSMFSLCSNLENINVSSFDTKNVTNMNFMFFNCYNLINIDLSSFDTKNVTNMNEMFTCCFKLNTVKINNCESNMKLKKELVNCKINIINK